MNRFGVFVIVGIVIVAILALLRFGDPLQPSGEAIKNSLPVLNGQQK